MELKQFYREIINEHNLRPLYKKPLEAPSMEKNGVNPSCGDDITLQLTMDGDVIKDAAFIGSGCAISQASADMMIDLIRGKDVAEAKRLIDLFFGMIRGEVTGEDLEELDESVALEDIAHMPARVKCALLGWRTLDEMLKEA